MKRGVSERDREGQHSRRGYSNGVRVLVDVGRSNRYDISMTLDNPGVVGVLNKVKIHK